MTFSKMWENTFVIHVHAKHFQKHFHFVSPYEELQILWRFYQSPNIDQISALSPRLDNCKKPVSQIIDRLGFFSEPALFLRHFFR